MLRALTILLGAVTAAALAFQVAMNSAMDIVYWETPDPSSGSSIWFGVIAVGVLLGATILVPHEPVVASVAFLACLPLEILYEYYQDTVFLSLEIPDTLALWIGASTVVLAGLAYLCSFGEPEAQA